MQLPTPILAEVADKMMSWPVQIGWSVGLVLVAWALMRKRKWLAVVPLPLSLWLALLSWEDLRDPFVGPAVVEELGYGYIALSYLPLVAIVVLVLRKNGATPGGLPAGQAASLR